MVVEGLEAATQSASKNNPTILLSKPVKRTPLAAWQEYMGHIVFLRMFANVYGFGNSATTRDGASVSWTYKRIAEPGSDKLSLYVDVGIHEVMGNKSLRWV